jgi:hypothetical protein
MLTFAALAGGLLQSASALAEPTRDHRDSPAPAVRDHRENAAPVVRDHREGTVEVRDHREGEAPAAETVVVYRRRPGPRIMLPIKVDLGAVGASTTRGFAPGFGGSIGIHWSSISPTPSPLDIGVGVFGALLSAPASADPTMMDNGAAYGGAYLEVGHTLAAGSFWRTWASGRGEYLASSAFGGPEATGFGASGRLSAELYLSGVGVEPRGIFIGSYAIGVFVEAGAQQVASGLHPFHVGGGLTFSTPLVFAL